MQTCFLAFFMPKRERVRVTRRMVYHYERGNKVQRWDEDFKCPNCRVTNREANEIEALRVAEGRQAHMVIQPAVKLDNAKPR